MSYNSCMVSTLLPLFVNVCMESHTSIYSQSFSQKSGTATVFQIGLFVVVEADLELCCSAGISGERLYCQKGQFNALGSSQRWPTVRCIVVVDIPTSRCCQSGLTPCWATLLELHIPIQNRG